MYSTRFEYEHQILYKVLAPCSLNTGTERTGQVFSVSEQLSHHAIKSYAP